MALDTAHFLRLGDLVPDFEAETTQGHIKFHDWAKGHWSILFSHPRDHTPVCTTELGEVHRLKDEWEKRGVHVVALSCDSKDSHSSWIPEIVSSQGLLDSCGSTAKDLWYPIIADPDRKIAHYLGMLPSDYERERTQIPGTVRTVFVIGPDIRLRLSLTYPASTGRNFAEILRTIDSLQMTSNFKLATPVNWKYGDPAVILPSIKDEDATAYEPYEKRLPYLRLTKQYKLDYLEKKEEKKEEDKH